MKQPNKPSSLAGRRPESTLTITAATSHKEFKALSTGLRDSIVLSIDQLIITTMSIQGILCMGLRAWVSSLEMHEGMMTVLSWCEARCLSYGRYNELVKRQSLSRLHTRNPYLRSLLSPLITSINYMNQIVLTQSLYIPLLTVSLDVCLQTSTCIWWRRRQAIEEHLVKTQQEVKMKESCQQRSLLLFGTRILDLAIPSLNPSSPTQDFGSNHSHPTVPQVKYTTPSSTPNNLAPLAPP